MDSVRTLQTLVNAKDVLTVLTVLIKYELNVKEYRHIILYIYVLCIKIFYKLLGQLGQPGQY